MVVLLLTCFALLAVLALVHRASRSLLFPPSVFVGTWLLSLSAIAVTGGSMLPVHELALMVYLCGALAFSAGGLVALGWPDTARPAELALGSNRRLTHLALDVLLAVVVAGFPAYWATLSEWVGSVEPGALLYAIRTAEIERSDRATSFNLALNLNILAQFVAMAMVYEASGSRGRFWRAATAVIVALVYGVVSGTKVYAVNLLLGLFFLTSLRVGRVNLRALAFTGIGAVTLFSVGLLAVNFVSTDFQDSWSAALGILESFQLYWLGGVVAFSQVVVNPGGLVSTQPIDRFFLETGRSLGFAVDVPPKHAEYVNFTPTDETNTFTIYFSYFKDHGWVGTFGLLLLLGLALGFLYKRAVRQEPVAVLVLARLSVGLVLSVHAEHFFTALNGLIKYLLFLAFLYWLLPRLDRTVPARADHA